MSIAGIDLGTGRIKAASLDSTGNPQNIEFDGSNFLPSVIYFDDGGNVIVGEEAQNLLLAYPGNGVQHWKRHIGSDEILACSQDGQEYRACDCARVYLEYVKDAYEKKTGEILPKAVLTVPANYSDKKKAETREAAEAAGIEVLKLAHEPTAALIGNDVHRRGDGWFVVVDVGHGTTDVSVAKCEGNSVEIKNTNGIPKCGGMDFTDRLVRYVNSEFAAKHGFELDNETHPQPYIELWQRCEKAKHSLAAKEKTSIVVSADGQVCSVNVTRSKLAEITQDIVDEICDCVQDALVEAHLTAGDIREFIPVGGGSLVASIHSNVEARFGKAPTNHTDAHCAVVRGAVVMARLEEESSGNSVEVGGRKLPPLDLSARDVTAHPIGVAVMDSANVITKNAVILSKGMPMPSTKMCPFALAEPGQTDANIEILQGPDGAPKEECLVLGHFELRDLQPVYDKKHRIEIKMTINKDGMLTAVAYDPLDGSTSDLQLDYNGKKTAGAC